MPSEAFTDPADWSPLDTAQWYAARDATTALRDVLTSAGLHRDFPYLRADVNAFGQGLVELGRISPHTARRVAHLLRLGLDSTTGHARTGHRPEEKGQLT
jgi:hypothetical protein